MKRVRAASVWVAALLGLGATACVMLMATWWLALSSRGTPPSFVLYLHDRAQRARLPRAVRSLPNPVRGNAESLAAGGRTFATQCARCHSLDGSGETGLGPRLHPPPRDLRSDRTQSLTDGELFYIVRHGIRYRGMPAWGSEALADTDLWETVHFVRRLPTISRAELEPLERFGPAGEQATGSDAGRGVDGGGRRGRLSVGKLSRGQPGSLERLRS